MSKHLRSIFCVGQITPPVLFARIQKQEIRIAPQIGAKITAHVSYFTVQYKCIERDTYIVFVSSRSKLLRGDSDFLYLQRGQVLSYRRLVQNQEIRSVLDQRG